MATNPAITGGPGQGQLVVAMPRSLAVERLGSDRIRNLRTRRPTAPNFDPSFYLASVSERHWIPQILEVKADRRTVGMVFTKERSIAGLASGVVFCDNTFFGVEAADGFSQAEIFSAAVRFLFTQTKIRGMRMLVPQHGCETKVVHAIAEELRLGLSCRKLDYHSRLALPASYEQFLHSLGPNTRRNLRRYRQRFHSHGNCFVANPSLQEFTAAVYQIMDKSRIRARSEGVRRAIKMLNAAERPCIYLLRARNGEYLSALGGWYSGSHQVTALIQLNSDKMYTDSLSMVLRGYAIETLISQGVRELRFWAGASAPLSRYCTFIPTVACSLDRQQPYWRAACNLASRIATRFPSVIPADLREYLIQPASSAELHSA